MQLLIFSAVFGLGFFCGFRIVTIRAKNQIGQLHQEYIDKFYEDKKARHEAFVLVMDKATYYRDCYLDFWFNGEKDCPKYKQVELENRLPWEPQL